MIRMSVPVTWENEDLGVDGVAEEGSKVSFQGTIGPDGEFEPTDGTYPTFSDQNEPERDNGLVWRAAFLSLTILVFSALLVKIRLR